MHTWMKTESNLCLVMMAVLQATLLGCSGRFDEPASSANQQEREDSFRPPLPKEWVGRWQLDPFAETEWIEVRHQSLGAGAKAVYVVKDAKVVESLLQELKVTS